MSSVFPFHEFLFKEEIPFYFDLVDIFLRENILFLSENCISSKVSVKDFLKELNKKFSLKPKLSKEQLFLAFEFLKKNKKEHEKLEDLKLLDEYFYGIEMLRYKKSDNFSIFKKSEKCLKCGLIQDLNKQGHCMYCRVDLQVKKKRKEHIVRDFLLEKEKEKEQGWKFYSADRVLNSAECGKERPDIVIDLGLFFLVLEIDEFQHEGYVPECERARVVNLFHALGCQKMVLVRFNPDKFLDKYYRKSKLDLLTRCEILHLFLKSLQENSKNPAMVEAMETIQEFKLFFDYNPSLIYTSQDCFISKNVIVKNEILDLFQG